MGSRLFVGNISYNTTEDSLRSYFEQANLEVVSARIVLDRETGRSRGFAFVELKDAEQAKRAIEELDQKMLDGRPLAVREARERGAPGGGGRDHRSRGPRPSGNRFDRGDGPKVERRHRGAPRDRDSRDEGSRPPPRRNFPPRDFTPPEVNPEDERHERRKKKHDRDKWERDDDDDWN